ncbi:hypothetical protein GI374_10975 [Paracoccus sp. S-4012]|uniref:hypothetical protein n=1 Tax=Paracoccus sp. S-4012 TaxID=2665648 RepID=UPI0012B0CE05|nr:hypothetical protein [Paracoccus sp. S-4012]MRX50959.1 hypothetical protein [Paracoccus sp. S-4012]
MRLAVVLCALALPTSAQVFTPPAGCTLDMTVQERSCNVANHYHCEADAPGDRRVLYFGEGGIPRYHSRIDAETRWIWSEDPESGLVDELVEDSPDHASLTTLLETGSDDFDFWTRSNRGEMLRHTGRDELTGETRVVDGITLDVTRFRLTTSDESGAVLIRREGQQFVSRDHRRFYGGSETSSDWTGEAGRSDDTPVLFAFPGEAGFGSIQPQFGCQMLMTGTPAGGGA